MIVDMREESLACEDSCDQLNMVVVESFLCIVLDHTAQSSADGQFHFST